MIKRRRKREKRAAAATTHLERPQVEVAAAPKVEIRVEEDESEYEWEEEGDEEGENSSLALSNHAAEEEECDDEEENVAHESDEEAASVANDRKEEDCVFAPSEDMEERKDSVDEVNGEGEESEYSYYESSEEEEAEKEETKIDAAESADARQKDEREDEWEYSFESDGEEEQTNEPEYAANNQDKTEHDVPVEHVVEAPEEEEEEEDWEEYSWEEEEEEEEEAEQNEEAIEANEHQIDKDKKSETDSKPQHGSCAGNLDHEALLIGCSEGAEDSGYDASRSSPGSSVPGSYRKGIAGSKLAAVSSERQRQQEAQKQSAMSLGDPDHLDDMLDRIKRLREERHQILSDMTRLKTAFDSGGEESSAITSPEDVSSPFCFPEQKTRSRKVVNAVAASDEDGVHCLICGSRLGRRLNVGAVMHMGLEDGDPICPRALNLSEDSRERLRSIALTKHFDVEKKFEMLQMVDLTLDLSDDDGGESGGGCIDDFLDSSAPGDDFLTKAESFLLDMDRQRDRDREVSAAIKAGLLKTETPEMEDDDEVETMSTASATQQATETVQPESPDYSEMEEPMYSSRPPSSDLDEAKSKLLEEIRSPLRRVLSPTHCDDRSECAGAGKVLRADLVPEEYGLLTGDGSRRTLLRQISSPTEQRPALRKVNTRDRSAPYIPKDTEITFYAGGAPTWPSRCKQSAETTATR